MEVKFYVKPEFTIKESDLSELQAMLFAHDMFAQTLDVNAEGVDEPCNDTRFLRLALINFDGSLMRYDEWQSFKEEMEKKGIEVL